MRADRLIAMMMLLQTRGRMTAEQLGDELEVSERTIYRDINALCYSGVPIYAERGPGGGISLVEQYRSDLTGLNKDEVRALFMLSIPSVLSDLGLDQEFKAALLKLSAALPATLKGDGQRVRQRVHIDPVPWKHDGNPPSKKHLQTLQNAIWVSMVVQIFYQTLITNAKQPIQSLVKPLGLVAKAGEWYLVFDRDDHLLVLKVERIQTIQMTGIRFERPEKFNLEEFWKGWCIENEINRPLYPVAVRVYEAIFDHVEHFLGERIHSMGKREPSGWVVLNLNFEYFEQARSELLGLGGAVEVIYPIALKYSIQDFAEQILKVYGS
jgi:predicted DNA-binding transcriptional regulator YafY